MQTIPPNPFAATHLATTRDYHAAWDVPEMNRTISEWLAQEVRRLRGRREPDPATKIAVINGPPGYGKTHLFGRVAHQVEHDVFFAFIPGFQARTEPIEHIRWYVVESLFRAADDGFSPLESAMAAFCQPAFTKYFESLPPTLATRHEPIRRRLGDSPAVVLEIVRSVTNRDAYLKLADSFTTVLPDHDAGVARALALGWAPAPWGAVARQWLQGQDVPEAHLAALKLSEEPPSPLKVLAAIPALFGYQRPMLICCDQIEGILQGGDVEKININKMSAALMDLLHSIPGQIVLSCFPDQWDRFLQNAFAAFKMRVRPSAFLLDDITADQAIQLIAGRLADWPDRPKGSSKVWPFKESSIVQLVREQPTNPRGLLQRCDGKLADWITCEEYDQEIDLGGKSTQPDPEVLFLQVWKKEIEAIQADATRAADYLPEERIYQGIFEALSLAQAARHTREFGGVRIAELHDEAIPTNGQVKRPGARVVLTTGTGSVAQSLIVAYTKLEQANKLRFYWSALAQSFADPVVGAVLIRPKRDLKLGKVTEDAFNQARRIGKLSFIALEDHPQISHAIECLNALLDKANERVLFLGDLSLSPDDCRQMIIKTGVIDNLTLFQFLGKWRQSAQTTAPYSPPTTDHTTSEPTKSAPPKDSATPDPDVHAMKPAAVKPASQEPEMTETTAAHSHQEPPKHEPILPDPILDLSPWAAEKLAQAVKKLKLLGQEVEPDGFEVGPTFARLRVIPLGKANFQLIRNKAVDLRISLGLKVVPIVGSQAGCISIDIQRPERATVGLAQALAQGGAGFKGAPAFPVGADVAGQVHWLNLAEPSDCHLLVAGTTGSGKSEFLRASVAALASRLGPDQVQFLLIDPKRVTFNLAAASPFLRAPVAHDVDEALPLIQRCMDEMDRRYALLEEHKATKVDDLPAALLPRIVVVIDEFASFLEEKESKKLVTALLKRIGAMARAAGIHLIVATQRPDKDVITPVLRENLPGRIALRVTNKAGSELILGSPEAEHLLGQGDLFWKKGGELLRLQSPFVRQAELEAALRVG